MTTMPGPTDEKDASSMKTNAASSAARREIDLLLRLQSAETSRDMLRLQLQAAQSADTSAAADTIEWLMHAWSESFTAKTPMPREVAVEIWRVQQPEPWATLSFLRSLLERELAKGERCGVCGNTPDQAKAINYDCKREC